MKTLEGGLAIVALAFACEKSEPPPVRPDPVPVPIPLLPDAATLPISACYTLVLRIDLGGTWIGAPADVRCYAPFTSGTPDTAWIEAEMLRLRTKVHPLTCRPVIEVGAAAGITYRQIVAALEGMYRSGLTSFDLVEPTALSMTFDDAARTATCDGALDTNKAARRPERKRPPPPPPPPPTPDSAAAGNLTQVRRVAVSRDAIFVDARRIVGISELPAGIGTLASVASAVGAATDDIYSAIIAPDASTDAVLLHRIVGTLKGAGYDYIWFETAR